MVRTACVEVYHYLLQILLIRREDWAALPCVVVTEDRPGGTVLDAGREALDRGVRVGMRFAAALSLVPNLRAATVPAAEKEGADRTILRALYCVSPAVEPFSDDPGVFWVDTGGMQRIFASSRDWGNACRREVLRAGFRSRVALGWTRAGTYAGARRDETRGMRVFTSREEEQSVLESTPLALLPLAPRDREQLVELGIDTFGAFRRLPEGSIRRRFSPAAEEMHRFLHGSLDLPVAAAEIERERTRSAPCPYPLQDCEQIALFAEHLLQQAARDLQRYTESIAGMKLVLHLERGSMVSQTIRPARPARDTAFLGTLIRLRLEEMRLGMEPGNGVVRCTVDVETAPLSVSQGSLLPADPRLHARRDPGEGVVSALSLLRARFGNDAVGCYTLEDCFLPEDMVLWAASDDGASWSGEPPRTEGRGERALVRRFLTPSVPIRVLVRDGAVTAVRSDRNRGAYRTVSVVRSMGPYAFSGKWWADGYDREYYYLELREGPLLWVYRDVASGRWVLQGMVE